MLEILSRIYKGINVILLISLTINVKTKHIANIQTLDLPIILDLI